MRTPNRLPVLTFEEVDFTLGGKISEGSTGIITILPKAGAYTRIGDAGVTSNALAANDDLFVSGKLEVDGAAYFDATVQHLQYNLHHNNVFVYLGPNGDTGLLYSTNQTPNTSLIGTGVLANSWIIAEIADVAVDFGHAQQTNPTLFIHSADATTVADWVSIAHNQTDGVIDCGAGTLNLGGTANVNFAGASVTGSTVTHDAYVELEVAGVVKKFMLGS